MEIFQIIPILTLVMYFFYMTYYYAAPMFWLKILLFFGHIRYRGCDIRFTAGKIVVTIPKAGGAAVYERPLEVDPLSRHLAATVCDEFWALLRDIRKGRLEQAEDGNPQSEGEKVQGESAD